MVLRLFVPPGEGQHYIVPKRPDPLGANATLQYVVLSSTALAAGYASFAARHERRIAPPTKVSRTALFIKASGRLGVWAIVVGAAANAYYHRGFTTVVVSQLVQDPTPPKLYEKTDKYTVEDGGLAGAAAGFIAFLPTLLMRRATVPWWTRMVGMTNIGAGTGVIAAHAYFQYTGERQKAMEELERQRSRRMLEFHYIFWDKLLMQRLDPLLQAYVRHNGIFRAYHVPAEVLDAPDKYGILSMPATEPSTTTNAAAPEHAPYYIAAPDWTEHLKALNTDFTQSEIENSEREKEALLKEAEYMAYQLSLKQHAFVHSTHTNDDDRQRCIRELQIMGIAYNRLRASADEADRRIFAGRQWLRQRAAMDANAPKASWLAEHPFIPDPEAHDPSMSIAEIRKCEDQFKIEIQVFESRVRSEVREDVEMRERWRRDLDEARTLLRATDGILWELEKKCPPKRDVGEVEVRASAVEETPKVEEPPKSLNPEKP